MKKLGIAAVVAIFVFVLADVGLSLLATGLESMPTGARPSYTIEESKARNGFIELVPIEPSEIDWHGKRIVVIPKDVVSD